MSDAARLAAEQHAIWDKIAAFWDGHITAEDERRGAPPLPVEELLDLRPGMTLLDVGCGNGRLARRAAVAGVAVVATDVSPAFVEIARRRGSDGIDYRVVDATDEAALLALGEGRFDAAAANMLLMNLARLEPLAAALARLLKPGGVLAASVPHPCFPWVDTVDVTDPDRKRTARLRVFDVLTRLGDAMPAAVTRWAASWLVPVLRARRNRYLVPVARLIASPGQPRPHYNFHRPLHLLLEPFLGAGFVLDALREPVGAGAVEPHIPWALVVSLRRPA